MPRPPSSPNDSPRTRNPSACDDVSCSRPSSRVVLGLSAPRCGRNAGRSRPRKRKQRAEQKSREKARRAEEKTDALSAEECRFHREIHARHFPPRRRFFSKPAVSRRNGVPQCTWLSVQVVCGQALGSLQKKNSLRPANRRLDQPTILTRQASAPRSATFRKRPPRSAWDRSQPACCSGEGVLQQKASPNRTRRSVGNAPLKTTMDHDSTREHSGMLGRSASRSMRGAPRAMTNGQFCEGCAAAAFGFRFRSRNSNMACSARCASSSWNPCPAFSRVSSSTATSAACMRS